MSEPIREYTLDDLMGSGSVESMPDVLDMDDKRQMAKDGDVFALLSVGLRETEEYGQVWDCIGERADGSKFQFGQWAKPARDAFMTGLATATAQGRVNGVCFVRSGRTVEIGSAASRDK